MTHSYPLYVAIRAQCFCCRSLQPFTFTSASDQVVCAFCLHHLGDDRAERRDADHVKLWVGEYADLQEVHRKAVERSESDLAERDTAIEELTGQRDELRRLVAGEFDRTASAGIRGLLESDLVRRAERRFELGERQLDWAMAVIWRVGMLHHDDPAKPGSCTCGRTIPACADGRAIQPQRQAIVDWERRNRRLLKTGKRHGLPDDHPDLLAPQA